VLSAIFNHVPLKILAQVVSSRCNEIHAVVNNAGIGTAGPLEWMHHQLTHDVISVNFLGHVAMTKVLDVNSILYPF
jgi:NAD(P)-dependent dehydrogenase (short-subunit alcohol dehydrogenase family)